MRCTTWHWIMLAALAASARYSYAAPMGFKDSWMMMGEVSQDFKEVTVNKALTPRDALGLTRVAMHNPDQKQAFDNNELTYTRLIKRWNMPNAQANVWFIGGIGESTRTGLNGARLTASPGVQLDYETTRLFFAANARSYLGSGIDSAIVSTRAGFSFYEANYDEIQPWFILEIRRMSYVSEKNEITPMLRLIHSRYFVEAGVNTSGQLRANLMFIF